MINNWIDRFPPPLSANRAVLKRSFIERRARRRARERELKPALIASDFYDQGQRIDAVRELNGLAGKSPGSPCADACKIRKCRAVASVRGRIVARRWLPSPPRSRRGARVPLGELAAAPAVAPLLLKPGLAPGRLPWSSFTPATGSATSTARWPSTRRWASRRSGASIRDEAINVFMGLPGDGARLELTYNHGVSEYDLGTGYSPRSAVTVEDMDGTLERLAEKGIEPEKPPYTVREGGVAAVLRARPGTATASELLERG